MKKPLLLAGTYFPDHSDNRMRDEGDVVSARNSFLAKRRRNLDFLLRSRFAWMNEYIDEKEHAIEVGAGAGFSKLYIGNSSYRLTDAQKHEWVDESGLTRWWMPWICRTLTNRWMLSSPAT